MVTVVRIEGQEGDWLPVEDKTGQRYGYVPGSVVAGGVTSLQVVSAGQTYWVTVGQDRLIAASPRIASGLPGFKSAEFIDKERAIRAKQEEDRLRAEKDAEMADARTRLGDGEGW